MVLAPSPLSKTKMSHSLAFDLLSSALVKALLKQESSMKVQISSSPRVKKLLHGNARGSWVT
jgi:hypothetical protein